MKQETGTGIGRALRAARQRRGKSLEVASRETRVRIDYLDALENESFEALGSDVYVRGFLRSYAKYLGLNHEKVIGVYERTSGRPGPAPAPVERSPTVAHTEALVLTEKKRPNWLLAGAAALIALSAAAAIGLLSPSNSVPEPAEVNEPPAVPVRPRTVEVGITAHRENEFEVVVDGQTQSFVLEENEVRSFEAAESITLKAARGGTFELLVDGREVPAGVQSAPFEATYRPGSDQEQTSPSSPAA
jgi:cytoskeleton protein RodZ